MISDISKSNTINWNQGLRTEGRFNYKNKTTTESTINHKKSNTIISTKKGLNPSSLPWSSSQRPITITKQTTKFNPNALEHQKVLTYDALDKAGTQILHKKWSIRYDTLLILKYPCIIGFDNLTYKHTKPHHPSYSQT